MVYPPQPPNPLVNHWIERHRNPTSFFLHLIGIPPTILGALLCSVYVGLFSAPVLLFSLGLFFGGYLLQFTGHALEGTDPGELVFFKRKLGLPYVEFPPGREPRLEPAAVHRDLGKGKAVTAAG